MRSTDEFAARSGRLLAMLALWAVAGVAQFGCDDDDDPAEAAGEAVEEAGDEIEDAVDDIG
jgi:hypothetical protein